MNNTMYAVKTMILGFVFMLGGVFAINGVSYAQVKSMTPETLAQYGPEDAYWVFSAVCSDDSERQVQRKTDGQQWCGKDIDGFCQQDKSKAADMVCGQEYSQGLALQRETQRAQRARVQAQRERERQRTAERQRAAQALAEQQRQQAQVAAATSSQRISIEEELIEIQQEKIELRREELELQRRAQEIQSLLGGAVETSQN